MIRFLFFLSRIKFFKAQIDEFVAIYHARLNQEKKNLSLDDICNNQLKLIAEDKIQSRHYPMPR